MKSRAIATIALPLLLAACAGTQPRFPTEGINTEVTPHAALRQADAAVGQQVLWGGVIVTSSNLADSTQIEVLAYPLDSDQRPNTDRTPSGRFLAVKPGYLETADFAAGRLITVQGTLQQSATGKVGEADYTYPVVRIADTQLWKRETASTLDSRPRVNFGVGVMIGR